MKNVNLTHGPYNFENQAPPKLCQKFKKDILKNIMRIFIFLQILKFLYLSLFTLKFLRWGWIMKKIKNDDFLHEQFIQS